MYSETCQVSKISFPKNSSTVFAKSSIEHIWLGSEYVSDYVCPPNCSLKKMRVTRKIFTRAAANLLFLIDFPEIFFLFLKLKMYILIHIRLCGGWVKKKFHPADLRKQGYFFGFTSQKFYIQENLERRKPWDQANFKTLEETPLKKNIWTKKHSNLNNGTLILILHS